MTKKSNHPQNRIIEKIISYLPQGRFFRGVSVLAGGAALGQVINVLASPILTRLYSPEDFGIFGVYASIVAILIVISSFRYEFAIPLPEDDKNASNVMALCLLILVGLCSISALVIYLWGEQITLWANIPHISNYLWLIPLGLCGAGVYQILNFAAIRDRNFHLLGKTKFNRGLMRAMIQVGIGLISNSPLGLIFGQVIGDSAGIRTLGTAWWKKYYQSIKTVSLVAMWDVACRYRRFPLYSGTSGIIESLWINTPQIFFATFYGAEVAGWFAVAQRVIGVPLNIVVDSISQVYFGEGAKTPVEGIRNNVLRQMLFKSMKPLLLIAIPLMMLCMVAPPIFTLIFGSGWEKAGVYVQVMGVMFAVRFFIGPFKHTLTILERQDLYFFWYLTGFILISGALLLVYILHLSDVYAIAAYSLSMCVSYLLLFGLIMGVLLKNEENI